MSRGRYLGWALRRTARGAASRSQRLCSGGALRCTARLVSIAGQAEPTSTRIAAGFRTKPITHGPIWSGGIAAGGWAACRNLS